MSERYRLVFRGEVQDGQHPAVVKKRLGQALNMKDERLEALFSGKVVILKREADRPTAARYQTLFKKSGARLRVLPLEQPEQLPQEGSQSSPAGGAPTAAADRSQGPLELLPPQSEVLSTAERRSIDPVDVDVSHLGLQEAVLDLPDGPRDEEPQAPDVSHLSIAEVGAPLAPPPTGARPMVDLDRLVFEVAEVGATMDQRPRSASPAAPDTSHLKIDPRSAE